MQCFCTPLYCFVLNTTETFVFILQQQYNTIMKNKHQKKQSNMVKQKAMIDSLIFQTNWGIKKLYKTPSDIISTLVKVELDYIIELNLFEDLLLLKMFVEEPENTVLPKVL